MFIFSCGIVDLSTTIEKSQLKYYRDSGLKNIDEQRLRCMNDARVMVFDSLRMVLENLNNKQTFSLIEGYDITNGELKGVLILERQNYFYHGSCVSNKFSFSTVPTIDAEIIGYYSDSSNMRSITEKELSSMTFIGTTVKKGEGSNWAVTHRIW